MCVSSGGGYLRDAWVQGGAQTSGLAHLRQVKASGDRSPHLLLRTDAPASPAVRCRRHTWATHHGLAVGHGGFKVSVAEARTPLPFLLTTKSRNRSRRKPWVGLATGAQRSLRFVISRTSAPPPLSGVCRQTPSRLPGMPSVLTEAFPPPEDAAGGLPSVFALCPQPCASLPAVLRGSLFLLLLQHTDHVQIRCNSLLPTGSQPYRPPARRGRTEVHALL